MCPFLFSLEEPVPGVVPLTAALSAAVEPPCSELGAAPWYLGTVMEQIDEHLYAHIFLLQTRGDPAKMLEHIAANIYGVGIPEAHGYRHMDGTVFLSAGRVIPMNGLLAAQAVKSLPVYKDASDTAGYLAYQFDLKAVDVADGQIDFFREQVAISIDCLLQDGVRGQTVVFVRENGSLVVHTICATAIDLDNLRRYEMILFAGENAAGETWKHVSFPQHGQHFVVDSSSLSAV